MIALDDTFGIEAQDSYFLALLQHAENKIVTFSDVIRLLCPSNRNEYDQTPNNNDGHDPFIRHNSPPSCEFRYFRLRKGSIRKRLQKEVKNPPGAFILASSGKPFS